MNISVNQVKNILNILPIGYYIKQDVTCELSETEPCSFCDIMHKHIVISYNQLYPLLVKLNDEESLENDIRCMLYHETSHALLTPSDLKVDDITNIFEDERIETLLKNFYHNVDFKSFVKRINNFNPNNKCDTAKSLFYNIVRFRHGPQQFVKRVDELIHKYYALSNSDVWSYKIDISNFYCEVDKYFNSVVNNTTDASTNNESIDDMASTVIYGQDDRSITNEQLNDIMKNVITQHFEIYESSNIQHDLSELLARVKSVAKSTGSAINAYSGKFDPRSVVRNDYKYFVQQNRAGHIKAFSKLHMNLFIDCSGSFAHNDTIVNKMLFALTKFEQSNPNFSFTLIACSEGQEIKDKYHRIQKSNGGTYLSDEIFAQYEQVQQQDAENINIVLYDGDAFGWDNISLDTKRKRFNVFNNRHSIIIVDSDNKSYVSKIKGAKVIVTENYTKELYHNIVTSLRALI